MNKDYKWSLKKCSECSSAKKYDVKKHKLDHVCMLLIIAIETSQQTLMWRQQQAFQDAMAILVQEPAAQKPMLSSTRTKPLFYGRVEVGESNDPCLPEVKWCISQKLIPPVVDSKVYHCVCPTNKGMKKLRTGSRKTQ